MRLAERVFAYKGVMQARMLHEQEQQEGDARVGEAVRTIGGGQRPESPRRDLADRTIIPLTPEMVASGAIPGLENDRGLIEHRQV